MSAERIQEPVSSRWQAPQEIFHLDSHPQFLWNPYGDDPYHPDPYAPR